MEALLWIVLFGAFLPTIIAAILLVLLILNLCIKNKNFSFIVFIINFGAVFLAAAAFLPEGLAMTSPWIPLILALIGMGVSLFRVKKEHLIVCLLLLGFLGYKAIFFFKDYNVRPALVVSAIDPNDIKKLDELIATHGIEFQYRNATPLMYAAKEGNKEVVKYLLSKGADIDSKVSENGTPLIFAIKNNKDDVAKFLIENGADVNRKQVTYDAPAPLHYAVINNNLPMAELLISKGADVDIKDHYLHTPLIYAVQRNFKEMADFLISKGADINTKDREGKTPLHFAIDKRQKEMVSFLLDRGADPFQVPFEYSLNNGGQQIAAAWMANGREIKTICEAAALNRIDLLKNYSDNDIDVLSCSEKNHYYLPTILYAVKADSLEAAKFLIEEGAQAQYIDGLTSESLLHIAVKNRDKEMVKLLIDNGAYINYRKQCNGEQTPIDYAIETGDLEMVKLLIEKGADINIKTRCCKTLLHTAVEENQKELVEFLILKGFDVNARDCCYNKSPLSLAKTEDMRQLLQKHGAK